MEHCILRGGCSKASTCKSACPAFIQVQGLNGRGGKQGDALVPSEYRATMLNTSRSATSQPHVYRDLLGYIKEGKKIEGYIKTFKKAYNEIRNTKETRLKDLYFWSLETGTGKTETASAILNEFLAYSYIRSILKDDPSGFVTPVFFLDMPSLQTLYLKFNRGNVPREEAEGAAREYYRRLRIAKKSRLVVFDEMGLRDVSEAFAGDIHDVINYRTVENLTSIYTSNVRLEDIERIYGRRIFDRTRRFTVEYEFYGESMRGKM
ncbi:DNA replication protein [Bacillus cereus]|uniref:DNA replication protein n=1 Tax=Bacillus cereus TaxID=1396 RepID=UPI0011A0CF0F|nr:DNA replication protein [Bacillus cereus]MEC3021471.1 DNA replication protein [Bacillus cereus]MEC3259302.1 DNA replication protein [Bacillus cereus]